MDNKITSSKEKPLFTKKSDAGKGDMPRSVSQEFYNNWDLINWGEKKLEIKVKIDENTTGIL